jgi:hypothetical protein
MNICYYQLFANHFNNSQSFEMYTYFSATWKRKNEHKINLNKVNDTACLCNFESSKNI